MDTNLLHLRVLSHRLTRHALGYGLVGLLLAGCQSAPATPTARVRVTANSEASSLNLSVTVEGPTGEGVSGALVTAQDPAGGVFLLPFDSRKAAYTITSPALAGMYLIKVNSTLMDKRMLDVPVKVLTGSPNLTRITDANGNEALSFQRLQASTAIRTEWSPVDGAQKYLVEAKQLGKTIWSQVVNTSSLVIPANTFLSTSTVGSSASLAVTASFQQGDIDFAESNVLSYASVSGLVLTFQVVP